MSRTQYYARAAEQFIDQDLSRSETLIRRARRLRRRGEERQAMLVLRDACFGQGNDARLWTLYGVQCVRAGRTTDAVGALKQAAWLRERARDEQRARRTRVMCRQVELGQTVLPLRAA